MANVKSAIKKIPKPGGGLIAAGIQVGFMAFADLKAGEPLGPSLLKAVPAAAAWATMPGLMTAGLIGQAAGTLVPAYIRGNNKLSSKYNALHNSNTQFQAMDTEQAATMRQAAVQAIQGSKLNARNALGGEASLMHRNYNSRMGI